MKEDTKQSLILTLAYIGLIVVISGVIFGICYLINGYVDYRIDKYVEQHPNFTTHVCYETITRYANTTADLIKSNCPQYFND